MKSYKEKREVLCDLAELYLNTKENSYISINDGIMNSSDSDSINFLIFLALTYSKEEMKSIYSVDLDINLKKQCDFIENEYKKMKNFSVDKIKQGKMLLDDAKEYYNRNYGNLDDFKIEEIASLLENSGIHI